MAPLLHSFLHSLLFLHGIAGAVESAAMADGVLYGTCYTSSGQRCGNKVHRISTSWNSQKGYPDSDGDYEIRFSSSVDTRITVYCDGSRVGDVHVKGRTRFDVYC